MKTQPTFEAGKPIYDAVTVKVMRSYDYCHFEVSLSFADGEKSNALRADQARKEAMRIVDKAVEQYKIAKSAKARVDRINEGYRLEQAQKTPASERTPQEKAIIKFHSDAAFRAQFEYDYQDQWDENPHQEDDIHF